MTSWRAISLLGRGLVLGTGLCAVGYAGLVAYHRTRYGVVARPAADASRLLDRFIPAPEVVEHHRIRIGAPAEVVLSAARSLELLDSPLVRALFKTRAFALGARPDKRWLPPGLVPQMQSIGWVILAERANREVVLGSVTRPWDAEPVFRSLSPGEFAAFREPGYVKILWTLRVEPMGEHESMFHTETRVATTDLETRKRFLNYWAFVAPGVELIRLAMLRPLKKASEKAVRLCRVAGYSSLVTSTAMPRCSSRARRAAGQSTSPS